MVDEEHVRTVFPSVEEITDDSIREQTIDAWLLAMDEAEVDDLTEVPWFPPAQSALDMSGQMLVPHVRDVVAGATALTEVVQARGTDVSTDTVIAGSLIHDVSLLLEYDGLEETRIGNLLGHPYYGVSVVSAVGLPVEFSHIVLSHTGRTAVEPATIEAELVRCADELSLSQIQSDSVSDLRDAY